METLTPDTLRLLALEMNGVDLINFCLTDKKTKDAVCDNRDF